MIGRWLAAIAIVGACKAQPDNLPVGGGGGGGGGGAGKVDAPHDTPGDGGLAGRVCLAADPRDLTSCAATGADGLTVTLGSAMATTAADGSFTIAAPTGTNLVWHVTKANTIYTSVMPLGTTATIPAISVTTYNDLMNSNGIVLFGTQGSLFVRVLRSSMPLTGATASSSPAGPYQTFYDGSNATNWATTSTGAHGVAWIAGAPSGTVTLTVTPGGGSASTFPSTPVEAGSITYLAVELP